MANATIYKRVMLKVNYINTSKITTKRIICVYLLPQLTMTFDKLKMPINMCIIPFIILVLPADPQSASDSTTKQNICMRNTLILPQNTVLQNDGTDIWNYLLTEISTKEDCCSWRGVECTNTEVTSFVLTHHTLGHFKWHIGIGWLPSSLRYAYIKYVVFSDPFSIVSLPRGLRFLHIHYGSTALVTQSDILNLSQLPPKMEEILLHIRDGFCGTVYIPSLPESLKLCALISADIRVAYIDNRGLPKGLKRITLTDETVKTYSTDGRKMDKRVRKK